MGTHRLAAGPLLPESVVSAKAAQGAEANCGAVAPARAVRVEGRSICLWAKPIRAVGAGARCRPLFGRWRRHRWAT